MSKEAPLANCVFVFTGEMEMSREEAQTSVTLRGARYTAALSGKTTHLVAGREPGASKLAKAAELEIKVLSEEDFIALLDSSKPAMDEVISMEINNASADDEQLKAGSPCKPKKKVGAPWAEKYRPSRSKDLLGNASAIGQLREFLTGKTAHKAVLLSGPPGTGKTSAAHVLCHEAGLEMVEFNASDLRSRAGLTEQVKKAVDSFAIGRGGHIRKRVLIMDEVDGMSSDRGGVPELCAIIKRLKMPVICICNDATHPNMRTLAGNCLDLRFRRLDARAVVQRAREVLLAEKKTLPEAVINEIAILCAFDLRYILNTIQSVSGGAPQTARGISGGLVRKTAARGLFDLAAELFQKGRTPSKIDTYFEDHSMLPLFVHENYPRSKRRNEDIRIAADSISLADTVDARIHGPGQEWALMPYHALFSCVLPTLDCSLRARLDFPALLGQLSKTGKHKRILGTLVKHCSYRMDQDDMRLYAGPVLSAALIWRLSGGDIAGAVRLLVETDLLKEDVIALDQLIVDLFKGIPTKTKTAFTREYKKLKRTLPYVVEQEVAVDE